MHNSGASRRGIAESRLMNTNAPHNASSLRTQGPIITGVHLEQKALATLPKRESAAYGSPRARGRPWDYVLQRPVGSQWRSPM